MTGFIPANHHADKSDLGSLVLPSEPPGKALKDFKPALPSNPRAAIRWSNTDFARLVRRFQFAGHWAHLSAGCVAASVAG